MSDASIAVNPWMILPFGAVLALIALGPLLFPAWWAAHYPKVCLGLGAVTLVYYFAILREVSSVWSTAYEYVSFMALTGSLFVVAGGIHIHLKGAATPFSNVVFLIVGAIVSNILGTTGASMLLIRPWLRVNQRRIAAYHIVFFIFIVSNVGGCFTPVGDPPLFLGYLMGVPFWWVARNCYPMAITGLAILLLMFLVLDWRNHARAPKEPEVDGQLSGRRFHVGGGWNFCFLGLILAAVFINHPLLVREGLMLIAGVGSYYLTPKAIHASNRFNFHPIKEVGILFAAIFATMVPALDWLQQHAQRLQGQSHTFFYWSSGFLSSILDSAPTYVCFFKALAPTFDPRFSGFIQAISVGAVFFGANTYIGNGPNLMVKAIAEQQKMPAVGFLEFIWKFTLPFMMPMLVIVWLLFLR